MKILFGVGIFVVVLIWLYVIYALTSAIADISNSERERNRSFDEDDLA